MPVNRSIAWSLLTIGLILCWQPAAAGADSDTDQWSAHDPNGTVFVNYRAWIGFMAHFSEPDSFGRNIDYLKLHHRALGFLEKFVEKLGQLPVADLTRDQQLAFWLNLHNAEALRLAGQAFPAENMKSLVIGDDSAWNRKTLTVNDKPLSLNDIAFRIIPAFWSDPGVVYGLFRPARSTPGLPMTPFTGRNVWQQLSALAIEYVNREGHLVATPDGLTVSRIYQWHSKLFANDEDNILSHLREQANGQRRALLDEANDIGCYEFDWRLNNYDSGFDPDNQKRFGS